MPGKHIFSHKWRVKGDLLERAVSMFDMSVQWGDSRGNTASTYQNPSSRKNYPISKSLVNDLLDNKSNVTFLTSPILQRESTATEIAGR